MCQVIFFPQLLGAQITTEGHIAVSSSAWSPHVGGEKRNILPSQVLSAHWKGTMVWFVTLILFVCWACDKSCS